MPSQLTRGQGSPSISLKLPLVVLCLSALCSPTLAAPNGLNQIPIAKVFGDGVASLSIGRDALIDQETTYTTQYGLGNNLEIGLDYQASPPSDKTFLTNAKYLFVHKPGHLPDIAIGVESLATGQKAEPYVVATTQPKATGISLGFTRPNDGSAYYGMAGVSYNVSPTWQIVADYIAGHSSYATLGVTAEVAEGVSVNVAYAKPNAAGSEDEAHPNGYIVSLDYTFHLKGGDKEKSPDARKKSTPSP